MSLSRDDFENLGLIVSDGKEQMTLGTGDSEHVIFGT